MNLNYVEGVYLLMKKANWDNTDYVLILIAIISLFLLMIKSIFNISKFVFIAALAILAVKKLINLFQNKK